MKKLKYFIAITTLVVVSSCGDKYLDTDNLYEKSLETYYKSPTDIEEAMAGVYNAIYLPGVWTEPLSANLMSDMMLGGGGPDDRQAKYVDGFQDPLEDTYRDMWVQSYNGIARANAIIDFAPVADFSKYFSTELEAQQFVDRSVGEALFMRAFYYFRLAKFFGGVPLIAAVEDPKDVARATYSDTFALIASDLKLAIELLPDTSFLNTAEQDYGHANKWVAEAYMARVYLFYTGYMTNMESQATSELPLRDGGSLSASDVTAYLEDCMSRSGYGLLPDFRSLWPYSYLNEASGTNVLPWAEDEGLVWAGQDGHSPTYGTGNNESMFVQRFSFGDWDWSNGSIYTNRLVLFTGMRGNSLEPFGTGWGMGSVNPNLWNGWSDDDPRKVGSIIQVGKAEQGTADYAGDQGDHETGLWNKKYTPLQYNDGTGTLVGMFVQLYKWGNTDMQLMHAQDFIFMRYADVLLMHSEITGTADGLNAVRQRAGGLAPVPYSLDALKQERLHEFSFEALRWFDLVRWGDVDTAFNGTIGVNNSGKSGTYSVNYRSETKGLVPIPETEIRLANGIYEQNPGW